MKIAKKIDTYKYELFGICNHSGNCLGGHYTAYVKNANKNWYCFNDTQVNVMNEKDVVCAKYISKHRAKLLKQWHRYLKTVL